MRLKSIIHATLALAAAGALCGLLRRRSCRRPAGRAATDDVRRRRHPHRRPAAHLRRHGLQLPADQHRRPARPAPRRRGAARAVRHRLLPRRRDAPRRRHAGGRGARAALDRELRDQGQQGHQDRGPAEVAAQRRPRDRQDLRPVGARRGQAVPHRPVLLARQVRGARRHQGRGSAGQQGQDHRSTSTKASAPASARSTSPATRRSPTRSCSSSSSCKTPNWLSWYRQDDRYAREALSGDLEKLRSYYMDRGYANFAVTSTQVAIAPEKDDIFVTINVARRRRLQDLRGQDRRQPGRAGVGAAAADLHAARRYLFAAHRSPRPPRR